MAKIDFSIDAAWFHNLLRNLKITLKNTIKGCCLLKKILDKTIIVVAVSIDIFQMPLF